MLFHVSLQPVALFSVVSLCEMLSDAVSGSTTVSNFTFCLLSHFSFAGFLSRFQHHHCQTLHLVFSLLHLPNIHEMSIQYLCISHCSSDSICSPWCSQVQHHHGFCLLRWQFKNDILNTNYSSNLGTESRSPTLQAESLLTELPGKLHQTFMKHLLSTYVSHTARVIAFVHHDFPRW